MDPRAGLDVFWRIIKSLVPVGHRTPDSTPVISSLNLYLGHHVVPSLRDFPQYRCMNFSTSHACHISHPSYSTRPHHSINTTWRTCFMRFLTMGTYPSSCYSPPLWCKYFLNHPVLEHPPSMVFLQKSETKFSTSIKNRQNYGRL